MRPGEHLSRRAVLRSTGIAGATALAGCLGQFGDGHSQGGETSRREDPPGNARLRDQFGLTYPAYEVQDELRVLQWNDYWGSTVVPDFEDAFGVEVVFETYGGNEEMKSMLTADPGTYDLAFPSDWMVSRLIREGRVQPLELSKLANWENLDDRWVEDAPYDLQAERYSAPYQWGTTGIAWHEDLVEGQLADVPNLGSWDAMWNEAYAGQIQMMDLPRETFAAALKRLGYSLNTTDQDKIDEAAELLIQQKDLVTEYTAVELADSLRNKRATPVHSFSGGAFIVSFELRSGSETPIAYRVPQEGGVKWIDTMVVPAEAPHPNTAHLFIDYLLSEAIGAAITNYTYYRTPNQAARGRVSEDIGDLHQDLSGTDSLEFIRDVDADYQAAWQRVRDA